MGRSTAQTFFGKISPSTELSAKAAPDTLKILAVIVDFQEDKDDATFGNGKFGSIYSKSYGQSILDPLPHDKDYFSLHLEFAKNYFRKVSNGKLNIVYDVLPSVITVSKTMRNYSPANNSTDYSLLGNLAKEVWTLAKTQNPGVNFGNYDIFTVFHAGVGRDVALPGSFGNEKDIPSLYLSDKAMKTIFPGDLTGLPQNRSGQTNTMFIPETESRESTDITGGVALVQISINGLIVANIASHLGLPDLYDTKTGLSAIGRFGLMDGQAIFTYGGTFPPEPSPWEKMYLGWISPIDIKLDEKLTSTGEDISVSALRSAGLNDTTVVRIPINSTEYYLVENRNRDTKGDGAVVSYSVNGQKLTKVFPKDTTGFYSYAVDSLRGVITDVDEFDWALPGSGIVIWHIDENVINAKIAQNQINTDKFNRGVDVEEADGVQDIGEKFTTVFGDEVVGEGTDLDFWFKGNSSKLYKNEFSDKSVPPSKTNSGAFSNLTFTNFTGISNKMTFHLLKQGSFISTAEKKLSIKDSVTFLTAVSDANAINDFYALSSSKTLYRIDKGGNVLDSANNFSSFKPAVMNYNGIEYVIGAYQKRITSYLKAEKTWVYQSSDFVLTSAPVFYFNSLNKLEMLVGTANGKVLHYRFSDNFYMLDNEDSFDSTLAITQILADKGNYFVTATDKNNNSYIIDQQNNSVPVEGNIVRAALLKDNSLKVVALSNNKTFSVISDGKLLSRFSISGSNAINSFSIADLKGDGQNYILFNNGSLLEARNFNGAEADNFPVEDPKGYGFTNVPLFVLQSATDWNSFIWAVTKDGRIFEISGKGEIMPGFPVSSGWSISQTPVLFNTDNSLPDNQKSASMALVTGNNNFYSWRINLGADKPVSISPYLSWTEEYGNSMNTASLYKVSVVSANQSFFPKERAYNWPNPVYGTETNIRYYVSEDSKINIKIFDLAGGFVAELNSDARGGSDNETVWNVSNIQSGVYLARIEASGVSGKKESSIIKIAVVR
ncbi:MAG: T9SS type A sorting domain-containing protein [Bacteroidota bacterium]|nr:T9SS type A sorting domain-containing protein [Bacteroidota bacterium]MDP4196515.1 T9SS type A sorting domain-containing protein [Bacteroidota bacterium]